VGRDGDLRRGVAQPRRRLSSREISAHSPHHHSLARILGVDVGIGHFDVVFGGKKPASWEVSAVPVRSQRGRHTADTCDTRVNPKILKCAMCKRPELFKSETAMARRCISVFRPVPPSTPAPDRLAPRALPIRYTPCHPFPSLQSSEFRVYSSQNNGKPTHQLPRMPQHGVHRASARDRPYLGSTKVGAPRTCVPRSATGCAPKGQSQVGHFLHCSTTTGRQALQTRAWPHAKRISRGASSQMMHTRASSATAAAAAAAAVRGIPRRATTTISRRCARGRLRSPPYRSPPTQLRARCPLPPPPPTPSPPAPPVPALAWGARVTLLASSTRLQRDETRVGSI
jgi:hypothetical protein